MTISEKLKSLLNERYISEDGEDYKINLMPGLTIEQITELSMKHPSGKLPNEIKELLLFARGFEMEGFDEVRFDLINEFGFEDYFPNSVQLAGDGYGNFWILDIEYNGKWGNVFYVCHDPAVVVKHSDSLLQFLEQLHSYGKKIEGSHIEKIHEEVVDEIWSKNNGFTELDVARLSEDQVLKNFALSLPDNFLIADLRKKSLGSGFAWGKVSNNENTTKRHETELIWGIKKNIKKGFFARIFG